MKNLELYKGENVVDICAERGERGREYWAEEVVCYRTADGLEIKDVIDKGGVVERRYEMNRIKYVETFANNQFKYRDFEIDGADCREYPNGCFEMTEYYDQNSGTLEAS